MFSHPHKNIQASLVDPGMKVADFGAGIGHYSLGLAKIVGESGKVYAIEIQKDLLSRLHKEAKEEGFENVYPILGDIDNAGGSTLSDALLDRVFIVNTLFQLEQKGEALKEAKRVLKGGGRLIIIDWQDSYKNMGPHEDQVVTKDEALKLAESAGFKFEKDIEAGEHHYGMVFRMGVRN